MHFDSRFHCIRPSKMAKETRIEIHTSLPIEPFQEVEVLPYLFFGSLALFLGALEFFNVEVYPDPVQQRPIACSERFEATEEPAVFSRP